MAKSAKKDSRAPSQSPRTSKTPFSDELRAGAGFRLDELDTRSTPGFDGGKKHAAKLMDAAGPELDDLQERLYAEATGGGQRAVLLVIQGMDTSGKGGIIRHVVGSVDPQGVALTAFKAPTKEEGSHPFLWRIRNALPQPGKIGVFDRSQYEDVLIVKVHQFVPAAQLARRYGQINAFEKDVASSGTVIIKVALAISADEQKARLTERLDRPDKYYKYNPGDVDERLHWSDYQAAYQVAFDKCSTDACPWYVVPADRKWYARLAVQQLLLEHLRAVDPQWPPADFDIVAEQKRLAAS